MRKLFMPTRNTELWILLVCACIYKSRIWPGKDKDLKWEEIMDKYLLLKNFSFSDCWIYIPALLVAEDRLSNKTLNFKWFNEQSCTDCLREYRFSEMFFYLVN